MTLQINELRVNYSINHIGTIIKLFLKNWKKIVRSSFLRDSFNHKINGKNDRFDNVKMEQFIQQNMQITQRIWKSKYRTYAFMLEMLKTYPILEKTIILCRKQLNKVILYIAIN